MGVLEYRILHPPTHLLCDVIEHWKQSPLVLRATDVSKEVRSVHLVPPEGTRELNDDLQNTYMHAYMYVCM